MDVARKSGERIVEGGAESSPRTTPLNPTGPSLRKGYAVPSLFATTTRSGSLAGTRGFHGESPDTYQPIREITRSRGPDTFPRFPSGERSPSTLLVMPANSVPVPEDRRGPITGLPSGIDYACMLAATRNVDFKGAVGNLEVRRRPLR